MALRIKNWSSFQHYKQRNPPWIKLHRSTLADRKFHKLPVESRALAPMFWLLASESKDGTIPDDPSELAFQLRRSEDEINKALNPLINAGFIIREQGDSEPLAGCVQDADSETETETEEEAETVGEFQVLQVAQAYPGCKYQNELEIPVGIADLIIRAIRRDGFQQILHLTQQYAQSIENPKFIMRMERFFSDPNIYRREWNADRASVLDQI